MELPSKFNVINDWTSVVRVGDGIWKKSEEKSFKCDQKSNKAWKIIKIKVFSTHLWNFVFGQVQLDQVGEAVEGAVFDLLEAAFRGRDPLEVSEAEP